MKKMICMLLLATLLLGICGCGTGKQEPENTTEPSFVLSEPDGTFQVGFGKADITPRASVPLSGYGNPQLRMSTNVLRRLYVTSVAMRDAQGNTIALLSIDTQAVEGVLKQIPLLISAATGIPKEHVIVCATHSHAAPHMSSNLPVIESYSQNVVIPQVTAAVEESLMDLKTATLSVGSIETENLNFVRHYQHVDENGQVHYFGDNFGTAVVDETTTHTTQADQTLYVLKAEREGEKDIVMTNWRAHPHFESRGNSTDVSSDFIGAVTESMQLQMDCEFVFYQGAAGNVNTKTTIASERRTQEMAEYASLLAGYMIQCLNENMTPLETGLIQTRQTILAGQVNHEMDPFIYDAKAVQAVWQATNDAKQAIAAGGASGIRSPYQANSIVGRYSQGQTRDSELNTIAIGDSLAFVTAPNELFDTLSVMTEDGSPYPWTLTLGYSNDYTGYIPSAFAWEYTCYESDVSTYAPGTGEQIVDCFLSMLKDMKG